MTVSIVLKAGLYTVSWWRGGGRGASRSQVLPLVFAIHQITPGRSYVSGKYHQDMCVFFLRVPYGMQ